MGNAGLCLTDGKRRAEFEDFDVVGFDDRSKGSKINLAGPGRAVVFAGELDIVDVETGEGVAQGLQMQLMVDEAQVFLDLGVAGIVPIRQGRTIEFFEEESEVAIERKFFQ